MKITKKKILPILGVLLLTIFSLSMSNSAQAVDDTTPPSTPSNLVAAPTSATQINLVWSSSTDNVAVTGYAVFRNGLQVATTTSAIFNNTGLTASTTYAFAVRAYDAAGNGSSYSSSVSATTLSIPSDTTIPATPTNLTATSTSAAQINLAWTQATDNIAVTGYAVFRDGTEIANIDNTNFNDIGLTASTTYAYTVKAYDAAGNRSAHSSTASATTLTSSADTTIPSAPSNLVANTISAYQINLTWTQATDNVAVTGYSVFRDGTKIADVTGPSYNNIGLTASTTYAYVVRAYDAAGNISNNSNTASATTLVSPSDTTAPSTPMNLLANVISASQINLNWSTSTDNVGVTGYAIFRDGTEIANVTTNSYSNIGLTASTTYAYTVRAYDAAGNRSAHSNTISATTLATPSNNDSTAPSAPSKLKAHVVSYQHVNLKWNKSKDNVKVKGYAIFMNGIQIATVKNPQYNVIRLTPGTNYTFTVRAYDAAGNMSTNSNTITVTTKTRKAKKPVEVSIKKIEKHDDKDENKINKASDDIKKIISSVNKNLKELNEKKSNNKGKNK